MGRRSVQAPLFPADESFRLISKAKPNHCVERDRSTPQRCITDLGLQQCSPGRENVGAAIRNLCRRLISSLSIKAERCTRLRRVLSRTSRVERGQHTVDVFLCHRGLPVECLHPLYGNFFSAGYDSRGTDARLHASHVRCPIRR
jgi:hypothetical protein